MFRPHFSFTVMTCAAAIASSALAGISQEGPFPKVICRRNVEEIFACGRKAGFRRATFYELELIEGISDGRAAALVEAKAEILKRASLLGASEKHRAFEEAHGIGAKTAVMLSRYLFLE